MKINFFLNNSSLFAKAFVPKNEDFGKFAKVLSVKSLPEVGFAKLKFKKRNLNLDFSTYLAKLSALKYEALLVGF